MSAKRLDALVEGRVTAEAGIYRERAGGERRGKHALACEEARERERGRNLRAVEERESFLCRQPQRRHAGMRQRLFGRHRLAVGARFALADQHAREMREWRQVARRSDRALAGHDRDDAGVEEFEQRVDDLVAHAGISARERSDLEQERQPHDRVVQRRTGPGGMRQHQRALQLGEARGIDVRAREKPETGVDTVDDAAFGDDRGNRIRSGIDPRPRAALEGDGDRIAPGRTQQIERQAPRRKMQSDHRSRRMALGNRAPAHAAIVPEIPRNPGRGASR